MFKKQYISTYLTEFLVMFASIIIYRICMQRFEENGFSEYSIIRRSLSFIQPVLMLGLGVGLPRYISINYQSTHKVAAYFSASIILVSLISLLTLLIFYWFASSLAYLFFGTNEMQQYMFPLAITVVGLLFHGLVYSYFRGKLAMTAGNTIQIINLCIIPFIAIYTAASVKEVFLFTGIAWITTACIAALLIVVQIGEFKLQFKGEFKELLTYGMLRVPGDIGLSLFFIVPVIYVAHHTNDLILSGYIAFSITLVNMVGAMFTPICVILLSKSGQYFADKRYDMLMHVAKRITLITLALTCFGLLVFEVFAPEILQIYLGKQPNDLVVACRIIFFSSIGYAIYIALRSILDAIFVKSINTMNIFICLVLYVVAHYILSAFISDWRIELLSFSISMSLLGLLTWWKTRVSIIKLMNNA